MKLSKIDKKTSKEEEEQIMYDTKEQLQVLRKHTNETFPK